jgi:alpha-L-fucosidase
MRKKSPVWQVKEFQPIEARYIKFKALKNISGDHVAGDAKIDAITK